MRKHRFRNLAIMLFAALVLTSAGPAWAIIGTEAGLTISNTASVNFTIDGNTTSKTSAAVDFVVDRKIRPFVTSKDTSSVTVVDGATDVYLSFEVTNNSNTPAGTPEYFFLQPVLDAGTLVMTNVEIWEDNNCSGDPDTQLTGDDLVVEIVNDGVARCFMIVADTPTGVTPVLTDTYNLVATAWSTSTFAGPGALAQDGDSNDPLASEIVFADDSGSLTGDTGVDATTPADGRHSDSGTFELAEPISITKTVDNGTSGYHIPGDEVLYTITVQNSDESNGATGVTIVDAIPTVPVAVVYVPFSLACTSDGVAGTPDWSINGTDWAQADADTAKHVRCLNATLPAAAPGPVATTATMTFKVRIP